MTDLYLILHKVRGEPAFDIASAIMIGEEQCWLIPTSGHRAYPIDWLPLNAVCPDTVENMLVAANGPIWETLSDHYEARPLQKEARTTFNPRALLEKIGLAKSTSMKRRSL